MLHQMSREPFEARGTMCPMIGTIDVGTVALFVRVAELQSFRGAADALGVPRSTVSRRIGELERGLVSGNSRRVPASSCPRLTARAERRVPLGKPAHGARWFTRKSSVTRRDEDSVADMTRETTA
jgi:hypothetical protein